MAPPTTKWGSSRLRVALVLDVTGSMASDGKMTALKTATKNLLTQLKSAATQNGDVYVSIIPFNKDVNVGIEQLQRQLDRLDRLGFRQSDLQRQRRLGRLGQRRLWLAAGASGSGSSGNIARRPTTTPGMAASPTAAHHNAPGNSTWDQVATAPGWDSKFQMAGRAIRQLPGGDDGPELQLDRDEQPGRIRCSRTATPTSRSAWSGAGNRWSAAARSPRRPWIRITNTSRSSFCCRTA